RHPEANERVELEAVEAEGTVSGDDDDLLLGLCSLHAEREGRPDAEAAERARVEPVAGTVHAQHAGDRGHDVAAVPDHDRPRIEHLVERLPEAVMVDRCRLGVDLRAVLVPPRTLDLAQPPQPRLAVDANVLDAVREDPENGAAIADDTGIGGAVASE